MEIEPSFSDDNNGNIYRFSKDIRNIYLIEENNELTELSFHRQLIVYRDFIMTNEGKLRNMNGNFYTKTKYIQIEKKTNLLDDDNELQYKIMIYPVNHDSDNDFNNLYDVPQDDILFITTMLITIISVAIYIIFVS